MIEELLKSMDARRAIHEAKRAREINDAQDDNVNNSAYSEFSN